MIDTYMYRLPSCSVGVICFATDVSLFFFDGSDTTTFSSASPKESWYYLDAGVDLLYEILILVSRF